MGMGWQFFFRCGQNRKKMKIDFVFRNLGKVDSKANHGHFVPQGTVRKCFPTALHFFNRFFYRKHRFLNALQKTSIFTENIDFWPKFLENNFFQHPKNIKKNAQFFSKNGEKVFFNIKNPHNPYKAIGDPAGRLTLVFDIFRSIIFLYPPAG